MPFPTETDTESFVIAVPAPEGWRPLLVVRARNVVEALQFAPPDALAIPAPMEPLH